MSVRRVGCIISSLIECTLWMVRQTRALRLSEMHCPNIFQAESKKDPCVLHAFLLLGTAALFFLTQIPNHAIRGNGYR